MKSDLRTSTMFRGGQRQSQCEKTAPVPAGETDELKAFRCIDGHHCVVRGPETLSVVCVLPAAPLKAPRVYEVDRSVPKIGAY